MDALALDRLFDGLFRSICSRDSGLGYGNLSRPLKHRWRHSPKLKCGKSLKPIDPNLISSSLHQIEEQARPFSAEERAMSLWNACWHHSTLPFLQKPERPCLVPARFVEPSRLEVLPVVFYYPRIEAGLGARFLEARFLEARFLEARFLEAVKDAMALASHAHQQARQREVELDV